MQCRPAYVDYKGNEQQQETNQCEEEQTWFETGFCVPNACLPNSVEHITERSMLFIQGVSPSSFQDMAVKKCPY